MHLRFMEREPQNGRKVHGKDLGKDLSERLMRIISGGGTPNPKPETLNPKPSVGDAVNVHPGAKDSEGSESSELL